MYDLNLRISAILQQGFKAFTKVTVYGQKKKIKNKKKKKMWVKRKKQCNSLRKMWKVWIEAQISCTFNQL